MHTATYSTLKALDADTGRIRWNLTDVGLPEEGALPVAGGLVYGLGGAPEGEETTAGRPDWGVHARNAATGALVWAAETGEARTVITGSGSGDATVGGGDTAGANAAGAKARLVHVVSAAGALSTFAAPELT